MYDFGFLIFAIVDHSFRIRLLSYRPFHTSVYSATSFLIKNKSHWPSAIMLSIKGEV